MDSPTESGNREKIEEMFNDISGRYDLLNHLLSFGVDRRWRRRLIRRLNSDTEMALLDVATGTGDLAIAAALRTRATITATDIAEKMMDAGRRKVERKGLSERITFQRAEAEELPFPDDSFDAAMVAFGVRNFWDLEKGLSEIRRVLKSGGKLLVLEFSMPRNRLVRLIYRTYFGKVLPLIGRLISKHPDAYNYLPDSVQQFPYGDALVGLLKTAGFVNADYQSLSGGIAMLYEAEA